MQEHEIAPPAQTMPSLTRTQALSQRLTASIQAETTLGIAARLDAYVAQHISDDLSESTYVQGVLADFYLGLVREGEALRRVASGA